jgi:hypothetical protein
MFYRRSCRELLWPTAGMTVFITTRPCHHTSTAKDNTCSSVAVTLAHIACAMNKMALKGMWPSEHSPLQLVEVLCIIPPHPVNTLATRCSESDVMSVYGNSSLRGARPALQLPYKRLSGGTSRSALLRSVAE